MKTKNQKFRNLARNHREKLFSAFRNAYHDISFLGFFPNVKCIQFSDSVSYFACCTFKTGIIKLNIFHVVYSSEDALRYTFMHEFIHLCGVHGHKKLFRDTAKIIMRYYPEYNIKRVGGSFHDSKPADIRKCKRNFSI